MKIVADDFEGGSTLQHGGRKFNTEEKNKYMESYYGIIDARKAGNKEMEKEYADELLDSLHNYVKDEIADLADKEKETARLIEEGSAENKSQAEKMLYTPDEIDSMNKDLEDIFNSSIDPTETNHIQKVNLVSVQCSLLFTKYAKNKTHPLLSDNVGVFASIPNIPNIPIPNAIKNGSYKNYIELKKDIINNMGNTTNFSLHALQHIEGHSNQPFDTYYLVNILPYISITEMMDAWFTKGIWMIGFSTRYQFTDGSKSWFSPIAFLFHDTLHVVGAFDCYGSGIGIGSKPKKINDKKGRIAANHNFIKNFYEYVKDKYKDKKDVLYSIKIIIFIAIHEQDIDCKKYFSNVSDKLTVFKESLWKLYEDYSRRIEDKNDLYLLLPARIRKENNSELVTSYIQECIHNYSVALNDYQKEKNMKFLSGGKKTKKRKLKTTKKTIKTRR